MSDMEVKKKITQITRKATKKSFDSGPPVWRRLWTTINVYTFHAITHTKQIRMKNRAYQANANRTQKPTHLID